MLKKGSISANNKTKIGNMFISLLFRRALIDLALVGGTEFEFKFKSLPPLFSFIIPSLPTAETKFHSSLSFSKISS